MKKPKKNSSELEDRSDPLAAELDFTKLERIKLGPGWSQVPKRLRGPKHLQEARAWLKRKSAGSEFERTAEYVLKKNEKLYRRLA